MVFPESFFWEKYIGLKIMQLASGVAVKRVVLHAVNVIRELAASILSISDILERLLVLIKLGIFTARLFACEKRH
jgi:hypothetical protein